MASGPLTVQLRINADGSAAIVGLRNVQGALNNTGQTARRTDTAMASLAGSFKGLALTAGAALSVGALAQSFIQANLESQRLAKGLTAVAGSATAGAAEMEYISKTADKLGLSLTATGSAYVSLTAATKGTALEGQATRDIFESVSLAMGKLGKSSADTQGALLAIEQMVSKGVVSAEELRGQLGERLPGAFKLAAEAMGVTEQELGKMLESGEILAVDLLPRLAQGLNKLYDDGKAVTGLEADWNVLVNAIDRVWVSADKATGATGLLSSAMKAATLQANRWGEALNVIANFQEGKGFAYGERDAIASDWALRAKLVDEYVVKMKDAQAYADANDLDNSAARRAEGDALISRINEIDAKVKATRADVKAARTEAEALASRNASSMGDDAIRMYREHQSAIDANAKSIDDLNGKYDKGIAKKAEYAKMEVAIAEAVKLGTLTHAEGQAKLEAFAAAQDKATESSRSRAQALSAEAQVVADVEKKYGLMAGQLDAVWKLESSRGKGAGTDSVRWVKDLAAGEGHMTKIVGQFQMAESTAKGLGANMATFNGQADAAGKYLAEAAAKGKTLWEQFAYYHGGPNEKAWGEKTRAYADAAVKIVADATGTMEDLGQNTGKVITDSLNQANAAVQGLIQRYLPARAAAEEYAQAQQALALASDAAGLSQEEQAIILQGLQQDLENSKNKASETADAWAEVWKNAVKRIDDTFANLWEDLFSGAKSTLDSLKKAITSWLAEVAHALITKPLVVAITTAMTGATGTAGAAGTAGQAASGLSSFSNIGSLFSSIYSLGSTFISGLSEGIMGMFSTNMFSTLGTAWGAVTSGSSIGAAAGAGVIAAYALPLVAAGGFILSKYFKDQEPRYGAYAATTNGRTDQFEDEVGAKGGFGLIFGMNDMGTANVDAEEMRKTFEGFAAVSQALASFYGKDVEAKVKSSLEQASKDNWGKNGLMNYAMSAEQAFGIAFADIIKHAAATGDEVAIVMSSVVGSLSGTLEEMADQIERGMLAAKAAVGMAEAFQGQEIGDRLDLSENDTLGNALKLVDYANAMKESGETTAEAMARMALNLAGLDAALYLTGTTTDATGMAFVTLANDLAKAADEAKIGMQGLAQLQAAYYQHFFTEEERALKQKEDSLKAIDRWNQDQGLTGIDTSEEFRAYIESLDLTTEAGRASYVEAMKLIGAFISLDNALDKLGDTIDDATDAFADQRNALRDLAEQLDPTNYLSQERVDQADQALRDAGYLGNLRDATGIAEFMRLLAEMDDAGGEAGDALREFFKTYEEVFDALVAAAEQHADLMLRLAEAQGDDALVRRLQRERELADALDDTNRAILNKIYAYEDARRAMDEAYAALERAVNAERDRIQETYQARVDAIQAEREALDEAHTARREAINAEREAIQSQMQAAQEALSRVSGIVDSIQSGLDTLRGRAQDPGMALATARGQLATWAGTGTLPEQDALQRALGAIGNDDRGNYVNELAYRAAQQADYANLLQLEKLGLAQKTDAEKQLDALDNQTRLLDEQLAQEDRLYQQQLKALDDQLEQANDWRESELKRLDQILIDAKEAMEITLGIHQETIAIDQALQALSESLLKFIITRDAAPALGDPTYDPAAGQDAAAEQTAVITSLRDQVILLRQEMAALGVAQTTSLKSLDDRLLRWDLDGSPPWRDDGTGQSVTVLKVA